MYFQHAFRLHQNGDLGSARTYYLLDLESGSNRYESIFNLGMIDLQSNNFDSAANFFAKAISINRIDFAAFANAGICYQQIGDFKQAEECFKNAYSLDSKNIQIINHLAATLSQQGKIKEALSFLHKGLLIESANIDLLINSGTALAAIGQHSEALNYYEKVIKFTPEHVIALSHSATALMELGRYEESLLRSTLAIELDSECSFAYLAKALTLHKKQNFNEALENYQRALQLDNRSQVAQINIAAIAIAQVKDESNFSLAIHEADKSHKMFLSNNCVSKILENVPFFRLKHDVQQANFLHTQGCSSNALLKFLDIVPSILDEYKNHDGQQLITLTSEAAKTFKEYQSENLIYQMPTVDTTLNADLDWFTIEKRYFASDPELIFIDNFLSNQALNAFQNFSLYSKIWNKEYKGSYLGAFANQGFISPLHLKLALDLKRAMPRVFKNYPIGQLWGFKYDAQLGSGINVHADFAKVNLNFWITPSESNLDADTGGLRVYTVPAPSTWTFHDYNKNSEQIYDFLSKNNSSNITIPYRGNRAVLFNSALFHETDAIKFKEGYENRRVNMTYLFGSQLT